MATGLVHRRSLRQPVRSGLSGGMFHVKQVAHTNQGCNLRFLDMTEGAALSALAVHVAELTPCLKAVKVEQAQVDGQTR